MAKTVDNKRPEFYQDHMQSYITKILTRGRSDGLVDKALGKGPTRAVYLEFDSRSGNLEDHSLS